MRIALYCMLTSLLHCNQPIGTQLESFEKPKAIEGLTLVAPRNPMTNSDAIKNIKTVGSEWIAVVPYAFSRPNEARVYYESNNKRWWGESKEGCEATIQMAKEAGLKVMLKPQVWIPRGWTGDMDFEQDTAWVSWEKDYQAYILPMAALAQEQQVDLFCLGTEFKIACRKRTAFWKQLIKEVRTIYKGKVTYAANWDEYPEVSFWEELDYVGINAYFPLVDASTPDIETIEKGWTPVLEKMERFQRKVNRPIIFTEFGYLSIAGCTYNTWQLEDNMNTLPINELAQANAYEALFRTFWQKDWWQGGFVWKWFPETPSSDGRSFRDYTPQGKLAETTLKTWYNKSSY
jgi:hypothetical protein